MILLIAEEKDQSMNKVIDWLYYLNKKFIRINEKSTNKLVEYSLNNFEQYFIFENSENGIIDTRNLTSCWIRRGSFLFESLDYKDYFYENIDLSQHVFKYLISENSFLHSHLLTFLECNLPFTLGNFNYNINKLNVLQNAKKVGLKIPDTNIITQKREIAKFTQKKLITKGIQNSIEINTVNESITSFTEFVDVKKIVSSDNDFFPTLFQNNIEKKIEIRVFYLNGMCYSMAIFSQNDNQTMIDFRKYNWENPNRNVLYKLPLDIEKKIDLLMKDLSLNTGSIDLIYSKNNEYIFLEVNPVGQFGFLSLMTNQNLFYEIAKIL